MYIAPDVFLEHGVTVISFTVVQIQNKKEQNCHMHTCRGIQTFVFTNKSRALNSGINGGAVYT